MARNNRPLIIGAAVLGVLGLLMTLMLLRSGGGGTPAPTGAAIAAEAPKAAQYVANTDISPRTRLRPALFDRQEIAQNEIPKGAITDPSQIENKLASLPIYRGQVLTNDKTTGAIARVIPANFEIPENMRAVGIWVNPDQTAAGLVDVGDRIDVIATHKFTLEKAPQTRNSGSAQITAGRVIAQNLLVLAVKESLEAGAAPPPADPNTTTLSPGAPGPGAPAPAKPEPPTTPGQENRVRVVVAAPPEVAARLVAAEEEGKLHVVIRNPASREGIFQVPEAREYPSRIVAAPLPRTANSTTTTTSGSTSRNNGGGRGRDMGGFDAPMPTVQIPSPNMDTNMNLPPGLLPPANVNSGTSSSGSGMNGGTTVLPPPDTNNEVTVIRGTEKTRVIVPR